MNKRPTYAVPVAVGVLLILLPALYMGSYLALLTPEEWIEVVGVELVPMEFGEGEHTSIIYGEMPVETLRVVAKYRVGGAVAEAIFAPANWVDRQIRPDYWYDEPGIVSH